MPCDSTARDTTRSLAKDLGGHNVRSEECGAKGVLNKYVLELSEGSVHVTTLRYSVYWQPACTSCLKAKEFLAHHGIDFESINVRETPVAKDQLAALGARSVPVIVRGNDWTYAQDLDDVARFIGVDREHESRLPIDVLASRVSRLLSAIIRFTERLPESSLEQVLPGRSDRAAIDLAWHVPMIVAGFLAAAKGGRLTFDFFERRPAGADRSRAAVIATQRAYESMFSSWWRSAQGQLPYAVDTYYGRRPFATVLERTAWHVAQHARQLEFLVRLGGVDTGESLTDAELGGLPLPEGVWDPEVGAPMRL